MWLLGRIKYGDVPPGLSDSKGERKTEAPSPTGDDDGAPFQGEQILHGVLKVAVWVGGGGHGYRWNCYSLDDARGEIDDATEFEA